MGLINWLFPAKELTREAFVQEALALLTQAGASSFTYDADNFSLRGQDHTWFLDNAFARTRGLSRKKRLKELDKFIASVIEAPSIDVSSLDAAAPSLKPTIRLRSRDALGQLDGAMHAGDPSKALVYDFQPLAGDLIMRPVIDTPASMMHVAAHQLAEWGISVDNVLKIAITNIRSEVVPADFARVQDGVFVGTWLPDYQPCAMLFPEVFRSLNLRGDPVVAPVTREKIYATGSEDAVGLARVLAFAEQALAEEAYQCSSSLYRHDGKAWSQFLPVSTPELERLGRRVETLQSWHLYEAQKALLDKLNDKQETDVFVASFMVVERDGVLFSVTSWAQGVLSLLPRTHAIALQLEDRSIKTVQWDIALQALGDLMAEEPDMLPKRWRVVRSPGLAVIASLPDYEP